MSILFLYRKMVLYKRPYREGYSRRKRGDYDWRGFTSVVLKVLTSLLEGRRGIRLL